MPTALRRETLSEQVAQGLASLIVERGLAPGDPLPPEAKLTAEFGVSRPIMREALRALQAQGIIDVANGKGATVRPITSEPLSGFFNWAMRLERGTAVELLELRRGIEIESARLAARRRTPAELIELHHLVAEMRRHLHDVDAYTGLDYQFHLLIATAARNAMLRHLVVSIRGPLKDTIREGLRRKYTAAMRERVQASHDEILAALEAGDSTVAEQAMAQHFDRALRTMTEDERDRQAATARSP